MSISNGGLRKGELIVIHAATGVGKSTMQGEFMSDRDVATRENVDDNWKWRTKRGGPRLRPRDMETRHLFYTLRMIWNHTMPQEARIEPYRRYEFGPDYTETYLREAVGKLMTELVKRKNMEPAWMKQMKRMHDWLATPQIR